MDNYFKDVYLKRMNKNGSTSQERIKTNKENRFDKLYLKRTEYQATIEAINNEKVNLLCAIEPSKWNQDKIVSNVNVSMREPKMQTGDLLYSHQKVKQVEYNKIWIIDYVSDDISHGYQGYEAIELDSYINFTDEYGDTLKVIPVKFVSATSTFVQDKFMSYGSVTYREPLAHRGFITQDSDFLTKGRYFEYKGRGWKIEGKDNVSINNIAYVSIAEALVSEPEPNTSKDILIGEDTNFFLNHEKKG